MMCTTVLHGGVWHRTSTPHKSGNTMKEKKKTYILIVMITCLFSPTSLVSMKSAVAALFVGVFSYTSYSQL